MKENRKITLTKKVLRDSLIELLSNNEISNITITMLCEHSNINRTTFYKYYKKPNDILIELEDHFLSSSFSKLNDLKNIRNTAESIKVIDSILTFNMSQMNYFSFLMSESSRTNYDAKLITLIYKLSNPFMQPFINSGQEDKIIYILHGSIALIKNWLKMENIPSSKYMATKIVTLALKILE